MYHMLWRHLLLPWHFGVDGGICGAVFVCGRCEYAVPRADLAGIGVRPMRNLAATLEAQISAIMGDAARDGYDPELPLFRRKSVVVNAVERGFVVNTGGT